MVTGHELDDNNNTPFVSTGELPPAELARQVVLEAYERYRPTADGAVSDIYSHFSRRDGQ